LLTNFLNTMIAWLETLATIMPIELFALLGSFIEELIAPIPSPIIMTLAGSIALEQGKVLAYLLVIAVISSVAKTFAGWMLYYVADVAEDVFMTRFGKYFGVTHEEIERIGAYISGGWKDSLVLFLLRSIPVMPSSPISVTCGAIKINKRNFLVATFLGSIIRSFFFLYIGYAGLEASRNLMEGLDSLDTIFQITFVVVLLAVFLWALNKRKKGELPWQQDSQVIAEAQEVNDVIDTTRTEDGGSESQEIH
jgi:membrane protein DedA with SNARE-associated domain